MQKLVRRLACASLHSIGNACCCRREEHIARVVKEPFVNVVVIVVPFFVDIPQ